MPAGPPKSQSFLLCRAADPGPRKIDIVIPDVCGQARGMRGASQPLWEDRKAGRLFQATVKTTASEGKRSAAPQPLRPTPRFRRGPPRASAFLRVLVHLFFKIQRNGQTDRAPCKSRSPSLTRASHILQPPGKEPKQHNAYV